MNALNTIKITGESPWDSTPGIRKFHDDIKNYKGKLNIVGGAVRDILLNRPYKDIDFICDLIPDELINFATEYNYKILIDKNSIDHGTVRFLIDDKYYEVTSMRKDIKTFGRHANVEFGGTFEEDAHRRDFTINSMHMDIDGIVYDYCGGIKDIGDGTLPLIRFVGDADKRVKEDYLRILRFFRMYSQITNSMMDTDGLNACKKYAMNLKYLSAERKRDELFKILLPNRSPHVLTLMNKYNILSQLGLCYNGPNYRIDKLCDITDNENITDDNYIDIYLMLFMLSKDYDEFYKTWKLDNKRKRRLRKALDNIGLDILFKNNIYEYLYKYSKDIVRIGFIYHYGFNDDNGFNDKYLNGSKTEWFKEKIEIIESWDYSKLPINGNDIIKELSLASGHIVKEYLDKALLYWIDNRDIDKTKMLNYLKTLG